MKLSFGIETSHRNWNNSHMKYYFHMWTFCKRILQITRKQNKLEYLYKLQDILLDGTNCERDLGVWTTGNLTWSSCMDECQRVAGQRFIETANISCKWKLVYQFIQSQEWFTNQHENGTVSEEGDDLISLFDLDDTPLNTEQKERTFALLKKMSHVFARDQNDLACD